MTNDVNYFRQTLVLFQNIPIFSQWNFYVSIFCSCHRFWSIIWNWFEKFFYLWKSINDWNGRGNTICEYSLSNIFNMKKWLFIQPVVNSFIFLWAAWNNANYRKWWLPTCLTQYYFQFWIKCDKFIQIKMIKTSIQAYLVQWIWKNVFFTSLLWKFGSYLSVVLIDKKWKIIIVLVFVNNSLDFYSLYFWVLRRSKHDLS